MLTFLPKKPPSRKSHQLEETPVPQVLMSKQIKDLSPRCWRVDRIDWIPRNTDDNVTLAFRQKGNIHGDVVGWGDSIFS